MVTQNLHRAARNIAHKYAWILGYHSLSMHNMDRFGLQEYGLQRCLWQRWPRNFIILIIQARNQRKITDTLDKTRNFLYSNETEHWQDANFKKLEENKEKLRYVPNYDNRRQEWIRIEVSRQEIDRFSLWILSLFQNYAFFAISNFKDKVAND